MTGSSVGSVRTLVYDNQGLLKAYKHSRLGVAQAALDQSFTYDEVGELVGMNTQSTSYVYTYDASGNRLARVVGATTFNNTIANTSNRLLTSQDVSPALRSYVTDAAGNVTNDGVTAYAYNDRGRMASSTTVSNVVTYYYNWLEQRVRKSGPTAAVPTGTAYYAYDEDGRLIGQYDTNLVPVHETIYVGDKPVAVVKQTRSGSGKSVSVATALSYVYADHLNTPRVIVRSTDHAIQWRWDDAEAFGATAPNANPTALGIFVFNQRFPGQVFDSETGNFYNWHRDYKPPVGRFVQFDPIGLAGGINGYAYVENQPTRYVDPDGLQTRPRPSIPGIPIPGMPGPRPVDPTDPYGPKYTPVPWTPPAWWSRIFNKSANEECKDDCDAKEVIDVADCEWRYKMGGRLDKDGMRACVQIARDKWVACYRKCDKTCQ